MQEPRAVVECENVLRSLNITFQRNAPIAPTPRKLWDFAFTHNGKNYVLDYHMRGFKNPYIGESPLYTNKTHAALRHDYCVILILRSDKVRTDIETALAGTDTLYTSDPEFTATTLSKL